ncbi:Sigma-54-dependent Fis family transcriptional regulator [Candidatus Magnetomoraceae bacterium gMMP-15]
MMKNLIAVKFPDGRSYFILKSVLQNLINAKKIKKFLRSNGWVDVETDQRKAYSKYSGPEKRKIDNELDHDIYLLTIREQLNKNHSLENILGYGKRIHKTILSMKQVAKTNLSVLLQGETGTGKGVIAFLIHELSKRKCKPFITVDCGAISETLIENELFGHEKGAFTGAFQKKIGKFEVANGGTIFLDEIANIPLNMQTKILCCLEEKIIYPVGGVKPVKLNIRIISATNSNLSKEVKNSNFRNDLYYRLNEFEIYIPSLRERSEDIFFLAGKFLTIANLKLEKNVLGFSEEALEFISQYNWNGNIREMKNVINKAALLADGIINIEHFSHDIYENEKILSLDHYLENAFIKGCSLNEIVSKIKSETEKIIIQRVYEQSGRNKKKTAKILGIDYSTLYRKMKAYE